MKNQAVEGVNRMLSSALGLGPSGRRRLGGGMFSLEVSAKPLKPRSVAPPQEEVLRRDVTCPHCRLEHAVFGLATWCPDCGTDIFLSHVEQEMAVIRKMLDAVPARRENLGARVAARDVENALEDTVSIFETVLKIVFRRLLAAKGQSPGEIVVFLEKNIRNQLQSIQKAEALFREHFSLELLATVEPQRRTTITRSFEKRHPITHNLGVVDRKYLEKVRSGEDEGRDVHVTAIEVEDALAASWQIFISVYRSAETSEGAGPP
jgi:predicted  nucleic acid-binding Zn-ribbon protein